MQASIIVFPGSNRERDVARALAASGSITPKLIWHGETSLAGSDLIVLPGGFSYGDYLRSGAIAANSPIMRAVVAEAKRGVPVLGVCNGFQILVESELLPGALMRNAALKFQCRMVAMQVGRTDTMFTSRYRRGQIIQVPVAHADGNYTADAATLHRLEEEDRVAFRYCSPEGIIDAAGNANGSLRNIAGIYSENRRVLGLMPHPEDAVEALHGNTDGAPFFQSIVEGLAA
jgi:phosphoribosylformylglycinamidine synthase I